jgi:NAD(P)-dependent dehydrogenase (short-subunit alcohol dehydrogenase family)
MPRTTSQHQRTAAITGAGSGLGRDIALGLAAKNYRVCGTAISAEEIADLKQASGGRQGPFGLCPLASERAHKRTRFALARYSAHDSGVEDQIPQDQ